MSKRIKSIGVIRNNNSKVQPNVQRNRGTPWNTPTTTNFSQEGLLENLTETFEPEDIDDGNVITRIDLKLLKDLQLLDAEDLILRILHNKEKFSTFADTDNMSNEEMLILVNLLATVCRSPIADVKSTILLIFLKDAFLFNLYNAIADLSKNEELFCPWEKIIQFWDDIIKVCENILKATRGHSLKILHILLQSVKKNIPIFETTHKTEISNTVKEKIEDFVIELQIKENEEKVKIQEHTECVEEPPDDFRQIPIYPSSTSEALNDKNFLRPNIIEGPYQNVDHYLDTQFRLFREDCLRPLKIAIDAYRYTKFPKSVKNLKNVKIHKNVSFLGREPVNEFYSYRLTLLTTRKNENHFVRVKYGALVCFSKDNFDTVIFGRIYNRFVKDLNLGKNEVIIEFDRNVDVELNHPYVMMECQVFFEPYFQVLSTLQGMSSGNFPMRKYIIDLDMDPQPPKYLTESVSIYKIKGLVFSPLHKWRHEIAELLKLDESQALAFRSALTQDFSIIQGPPGTGKTYVGLKIVETLLKNQRWWHKRSPLLIICQTNHALDQFLEGVLAYTKKILRVGGRTTKDNLMNFALKGLRGIRNCYMWDKLKYSNKIAAQIKELSELLKEIDSYRSVISFDKFEEVKSDTWFFHAAEIGLIEWLMAGREKFVTNNDNEGEDICGEENENVDKQNNFSIISLQSLNNELQKLEKSVKADKEASKLTSQSVLGKIFDLKTKYKYLSMRLREGQQSRPTKPPSTDLVNPTKMNPNDRWKLYFYWLKSCRQHLSRTLDTLYLEYQTTYQQYDQLRTMEIVKSFRDALVVGMTTTMAARHKLALECLKCPIVIVEEAAKILEAQIVTSVTEHCEQLILIGDHQQLRPRTVDSSIEEKYKLGISLFERMIINSRPFEYNVLQTEHRMRSEILTLLSPIYPFLENDQSALSLPVKGMDKCLFFIDELSNEVSFFVYLSKYLLLNGYTIDNITILTLYEELMGEFRREVSKHDDLKDVRVSLLDHYQGEENDIILLSFGNKYDTDKVALLSSESRICVALSRAKEALYIAGNMTQLCQEHDLWLQIRAAFEDQNAIGPKLPLKCQMHQTVVTYVESDVDFMTIPDGGCTRNCGEVLECGHECNLVCHMRNRDHQDYQCEEECNRSLCAEISHKCRKKCFQKCGTCKYLVQTKLLCGHGLKVECHLTAKAYDCPVIVRTELSCGHFADKPCHQIDAAVKCYHVCNKILNCGHTCGLMCHVGVDPDHLEYKCKKRCTKYLKACSTNEESHRCRKQCFEECDICTIPVKKQRDRCCHVVEVPCHLNVDGDCMEKVTKNYPVCGHSVKVKCSEEPNRKFCTKRCSLQLPCGHPCSSKCNEPCTAFCTVMIECSIPTECGHSVTQIKCHKFHTSNFQQEVLPIKFCTKRCDTLLECGHLCSGNCNDCFQGRFHKRCEEKTTASLICNHQCEVPCKEVLNPCNLKCIYKCQHNSCSKGCSEVCTPCKKKCARSCIHQNCAEKCGDLCSVPPCEESCEKKLKCGHACIGFCGDPCPSKCLICDEKYFDLSVEENERYVLLNDCKHIVASSKMEERLKERNHDLEFKTCVKCGIPIISTQRYSDYFKRTLTCINDIKTKINGTAKEIEEKRYMIQEQLFTLKQKGQNLNSDFSKIKNTLDTFESNFGKSVKDKKNSVNSYMVETLRSKLKIVEHMTDSCDFVKTLPKYFTSEINFILNILKREQNYFTRQEIDDVSLELNKYVRMVQFAQIKTLLEASETKSSLQKFEEVEKRIETYFSGSTRFCKHDDDAVLKLLELCLTISSGNIVLENYDLEIFVHSGFGRNYAAKNK